MSQFNNRFNPSDNIQSAMFADCISNSKEIFKLIDSILPLESCLHYEVLPLKLEANHFTLGMLNPQNQDALNFIRSIANAFHYTLDIQLIDAQTHQLILEDYLKNPTPEKIRERDHHQTIVEPNFSSESSSQSSERPKSRRLSDSAPTIISQPEETPSKSNSKSSVALPMPLRDLPPDLDFLRDLSEQPEGTLPKSNIDASKTLVDFSSDFDLVRDLPNQPERRLPKSPVDVSMTLTEISQEFRQQGQSINLDEKPTVITDDPEKSHESEIIFSEAQISNLIRETEDSRDHLEINDLSILKVQAESVPKSTDFLADLTWELSWQELLDKALNSQIDQLHLERYSNHGKITANKGEITQSSLEQIPLPLFCSAINQIKRMAQLSTSAVEKPSKVILEKFHQQERILLRLEFIPNSYGEKVIVQILRDKALKAYEQKQMDKISEQALSLAQQLEKTLRKIQVCFESAEFTNLRELQGVQNRINQQLKSLDK